MGLYKRGRVWWIAFTTDKKNRRVSTGQTNRKDAERVWAETKIALVTGNYVPEEERHRVSLCPTFEIAVKSYRQHQLDRGRSAGSYKALTENGLWVEALCGRQLDKITAEEIEAQLDRWQAERGWSNATRNNRLAQLSALFSYAYGRRWIEHHPTEKGRVPKRQVDNARERWLRPAEIEALVGKATEADRAWLVPIVRFAVSTGMRLGEICGLRRDDLERDEQGRAFLAVRKTKNRTPIVWPLEGETLALVEAQLQAIPRFPAAYIFPGPAGGSAYRAVPRQLRAVAKAAGIEWGCTRTGFTFHSLRRTMATLGLNAGIPKDQIQRVGNWKTAAMVDRYARYSDETLRDTAAKLARITSSGGGGSAHSFTVAQGGAISRESNAATAAPQLAAGE